MEQVSYKKLFKLLIDRDLKKTEILEFMKVKMRVLGIWDFFDIF